MPARSTDWKSGYDRFASSPIKVADGIIYHAATKDELAKVVHDFGVAARKCKLAGCDGVQIHGRTRLFINNLSFSTF